MKNRKLFHAILFVLLIPVGLIAQNDQVDLSVIYKIRQEGQKNSKIEDLSYELTDFIGPRLTASAGYAKSVEWAIRKMEEFGFQNVHMEEARDFSRGGWDNLKTYAAMTAPYYANFACNPVAWTGGTNGLVKGKVILLDAKTESDFEKYRGQLTGKIVLVSSTNTYEVSFEPLAARYTDEELKNMTKTGTSSGRRGGGDYATYMAQRQFRMKLMDFLKTEQPAILLNSSGVFNVPGSTGTDYTAGEKEPIALLNLPVEAHSRVERLLKHGVPVEMEVEVWNKFYASPKVYNVIGEIPGTDKVLKNEVVLIGAHLDSWHGGTGAADNASGCVVMMEALRILKSIEAAPKRTIRVALWGGEEQGLHGSRGYVEKHLVDPATKEHKPGYEKFAGYFNMDNGTGRYRGIYLQENELVRPLFEAWLKPFEDMGASTIILRNTGGTDHLSFDAVGLPGFQFIQDRIEYGRGYHTTMDTYERLLMADLKQNAIITAAFAYHAAMLPVKLPAKPLVKSLQSVEKR